MGNDRVPTFLACSSLKIFPFSKMLQSRLYTSRSEQHFRLPHLPLEPRLISHLPRMAGFRNAVAKIQVNDQRLVLAATDDRSLGISLGCCDAENDGSEPKPTRFLGLARRLRSHHLHCLHHAAIFMTQDMTM